MERKLTPKGRRARDAIIQAALVQFGQHGYRGTTLAGVAAEAGITKSALMHYFSVKEDLLRAVLMERAAWRREREPFTYETLEEYLSSIHEIVSDNERDDTWARLLTVIVAESLTQNHPASQPVRERYSDTIAAFVDRALTPGFQHQGFDPVAANNLARLMVAVMDGLQLQKLVDPTTDMVGVFTFLADMVRDALPAGVVSPSRRA